MPNLSTTKFNILGVNQGCAVDLSPEEQGKPHNWVLEKFVRWVAGQILAHKYAYIKTITYLPVYIPSPPSLS